MRKRGVAGYRNPVHGIVASTRFTKARFKEDRFTGVHELAEHFASKHGYTATELKDELGFRITLKTEAKQWEQEQARMPCDLPELKDWLVREHLYSERRRARSAGGTSSWLCCRWKCTCALRMLRRPMRG